MTLENILTTLRLVMNGKLEQINETLLEEAGIKNALISFFAEQQVRPELTTSIKSQTLMCDYLQLKLEEKEEMERFRRSHPEYFNGQDVEIKRLDNVIKSKKSEDLIKKQMYVNQLLRIFTFYLENREEGDVLNINYLQKNQKLKEKYQGLGVMLYVNAQRNLKEEGGINYIVQLTAQQNPEILEHWQGRGEK